MWYINGFHALIMRMTAPHGVVIGFAAHKYYTQYLLL